MFQKEHLSIKKWVLVVKGEKMAKTFHSVERARKYAKKVGGVVCNNPEGYTNKKVGHLVVRKSCKRVKKHG